MSWTLFLSVHLYWLLIVEAIFIVIFSVAKHHDVISAEDAEIAKRNGMTYNETNQTYTTVNRHTTKKHAHPLSNPTKSTLIEPVSVEHKQQETKQKKNHRYSDIDYDDYSLYSRNCIDEQKQKTAQHNKKYCNRNINHYQDYDDDYYKRTPNRGYDE